MTTVHSVDGRTTIFSLTSFPRDITEVSQRIIKSILKKLLFIIPVLFSFSSFSQYRLGLRAGWDSTYSTLALGIDSNYNKAHLALVSKKISIVKDSLLGNIEFYSNDMNYNDTPNLCGYIRSIATGTHNTNTWPASFEFGTTTAGKRAPDTKMVLDNNGALTLTGGTYNIVNSYDQDTLVTLTGTDRTALVSAENHSVVVTVPRPTQTASYSSVYKTGITYFIKKTDATGNNITIRAAAGSPIKFDDANSITLSKPNSSVVIQSDGTGYKILATNVGTDLYSEGTGINITGDLITNTGDLSITNELQNLSATQTGSTVSVNISGGTGTSFSVQEPTTVLTSSATANVNNRYISNSGTRITITLPTTPTVGDVIYIVGLGAGGWKLQLTGSQVIHGTSNTSSGGSLDSGAPYNCAELRYVATNEWVIVNSTGTLTFN